MAAANPALTKEYRLHVISLRIAELVLLLTMSAHERLVVAIAIVGTESGKCPAPGVAAQTGDGGEVGLFAGLPICGAGGVADHSFCG